MIQVDTLHLIPPIGRLFSQQGLEIKGNLSFVREVLYYSEGSPLSVLVEEQIALKIRSNLHIRQCEYTSDIVSTHQQM